jgi:hypothetical protein
MSSSNQAGKGDKPRPVNKKRFDTNYDSIKWTNNSTSSSTAAKHKKNKITYKY